MFLFFFNKSGNIISAKQNDYDSLISILNNLKVEISNKYWQDELLSFWQGDEAKRCIAESIVTDSLKNKEVIQILKNR